MAATNTQSRPTRSFEEVNREILARLDILAEYRALGVTFVSDRPRASGKISCYARGRDESHPSAYVDVNTGRYGDSGGESPESLSLWDFAAKYGGGKFADWKAARRHYADVAGVAIGKSKAAEGEENPAEALEFIPWSAGEERLASLWCAKHKPGVTLVALKLAGARIAFYPCWTDKKTGTRRRGESKVIALPCFGEQLAAADPVAWVVWNINGNPLKVFRGKDKPPDLVKMKSVGPTWGTLGNLQALERLASAAEIGDDEVDGVAESSDTPTPLVVWKTEGPTDGLALLGLLPPALRDSHLVTWNFSGATGDVPAHVVAALAYHKVALVHDADAAGEAGVKKWGDALAGVTQWTRQVRLPYPIEPKHGKDLRQWIAVDGGSYTDLCRMLADAPDLKQATAPAVPQPSANGHHVAASDGDGGETKDFQSNEGEDDPHRLARLYLDRDAGRHPDGLTLHYWREEWWQFHIAPHVGGRYISLKDSEVKSRVTGTCKAEFDRINIDLQAERASKDGEIPHTTKVTRSLVYNVVGALQNHCLVQSSIDQPAWLEPTGRPNLVAMANGLLCLDSLFAALGASDAEQFSAGPHGQLPPCMRPHSPRWFSSVCLPYPFDGAAECPRFLAFLNKNLEGDAERISVLQEFAGYLLTPDTSYQKFLVLEGEGANGKSVFCAVLEAMLGRENVSHVQLELFAQRFALTPTLGKLANIAAEVGELDKVAEGFVKSFTSGDRMQFDRKHLSAVDATPTARLVIATNNRPRFSDRSSGIWRRMLLVPWQVQIAEAERVLGMDKPEWWEASGELPGIFNWAVAGLWRLRQQHRFTRSKLCEEALDEYRSETNPARSFLLDTCIASTLCEIPTAELYWQYKQWCDANGYRALGERIFGKEVKRAFPKIEKSRTQKNHERSYSYFGIGYRNSLELFK